MFVACGPSYVGKLMDACLASSGRAYQHLVRFWVLSLGGAVDARIDCSTNSLLVVFYLSFLFFWL